VFKTLHRSLHESVPLPKLLHHEETLFESIHYMLQIIYIISWLELVHAVKGLTKSGIYGLWKQTIARSIHVYLIMPGSDEFNENFGLTLLVLGWGITEVVKYSFYFWDLMGDKGEGNFFTSAFEPLVNLTRCLRYNMFLVLYPLGAGTQFYHIYLVHKANT
jgi:very-long-chain (3R)-3-hydroxyacyl-CoA dehydratase